MTTIINELPLHQRALLHAALQFFQLHAEEAYAETIIKDNSPLYRHFFKFTNSELKEIQNTLFAESFIEDMDYIRHFNKIFPELVEQEKKTIQAINNG